MLGIREEIEDKGDRGNHNEGHDDGLAEGDSKEADEDGDGTDENSADKHRENSGDAAGNGDAEGSGGTTGEKASDNAGDVEMICAERAVADDLEFDALDETVDAFTEDIGDVNGESADEIGEI